MIVSANQPQPGERKLTATNKVKEYAGQATGDKRMKTEGKGDQAKGGVKQAGENLKDAAKDTTRH